MTFKSWLISGISETTKVLRELEKQEDTKRLAKLDKLAFQDWEEDICCGITADQWDN